MSLKNQRLNYLINEKYFEVISFSKVPLKGNYGNKKRASP